MIITDMQAHIHEYIMSAPEYAEDGKIALSVIITGADLFPPPSDHGGSDLICADYIICLDDDFARDMCYMVNSIIGDDNISVIAIDVSKFPRLVIVADRRALLGYDNIDPQFTCDIMSFVDKCRGRRTQSLLIVNVNMPSTILRLVDY